MIQRTGDTQKAKARTILALTLPRPSVSYLRQAASGLPLKTASFLLKSYSPHAPFCHMHRPSSLASQNECSQAEVQKDAMKPQSCKAKGRRLQQMIVADLLALFPHLGEDDVRSTSMGAAGEDIQLSNTARRAIPFSIEAKNQERVNVWNAMEQSRANAPAGVEPVVVFKKNNEKPHVLLTWDCFKRLLVQSKPADSNKGPRELLLEAADHIQRIAATLD